MTDQDYGLSEREVKIVEGIVETYRERIEEILEGLQEEIEHQGLYTSGLDYYWDDDPRWSFLVSDAPITAESDFTKQKAIDVQFQICLSEGQEDREKLGLNFSLSSTRTGGLIVTSWAPYNYTSTVWVDAGDEEAVRDRFGLADYVICGGFPALANTLLTELGQDDWETA